ncbi:MAG: Gfo/Idh/MocA family oxidoreductase [Propionicimonas sp.]
MLRIAIIGAGGISRAHLDGYLEFPDQCEVVALCDLSLAKAVARRAEYGLAGVRVYDDPAAMLAAEKLDLVSVTTPPASHAPVTVAALWAGVNVLVEKPMAPSLEDCDAMLAAQRATGKLLSVVAQNRFRDDLATLKEVLESGLPGPVSHLQVNSAWSRGLAYYDLWWRGTWASEGGGCTLNHAIHHIDLTLWLLGRPKAVTAVLTNAQHDNSEVEDLSVAILAYERALAELTSSVVHHGEEREIVVQARDARVSQPWRAVADLHQPNGFPAGSNAALVERLDALASAHRPLAHAGHAGQVGDVLDALATGRPPTIDGLDGRNAIEVVTAIYESAIEGRTVALPLAADDPYYRAGTLVERAPRFFAKTAAVADQDGFVTVSDH